MDDKYLEIILERIRVCKKYKPKFGHGQETSLEAFQSLYGTDPFYSWFGLDNSLMYAAHRAAGGITSIYRQIGIGCEELFRQILQDQLGLSDSQVKWSYGITASDGRERRLALDGRIQLVHSTYAFTKDVIGYDLAGFFQRNSTILKDTVADVLTTLLTTHTDD